MPIHKVTKNGKTGYQYGTHGHIYTTRAAAVKQAAAIHASGYREPTMSNKRKPR
jgi:hypothetical protein